MGPKRIILKSSSGSSAESVTNNRPTRSSRTTVKTKATVRRASPRRSSPRKTSPQRGSPKKTTPQPQQTPSKRTAQDSDISLSLSEDEQEADDLSISSAADDGDEGGGLDSEPEDYSSDNEENSEISQSEEESVQTGRLTARQRSILQAESIESTPSLESLSIPLTEEEQLRKSEKTRRRAVQRDLKLEQSKADTIKRLLQKQSTRSKKMKLQEKAEEVVGVRKERVNSMGTGMIRYIANKDQTRAILGADIPLIIQRSREHPRMTTCAVPGCGNPKKYLHSKLLRPVCSLDCYKSLK